MQQHKNVIEYAVQLIDVSSCSFFQNLLNQYKI